MFIHELKSPAGSRKRRKIVGRGKGSGHGKTSCRGMKGQNSRSGRATRLGHQGGQMALIRLIPKVGFNSKRPILYQVVKLESLTRFKEGTVVDAAFLKSHQLISSSRKPYKILGDGEFKKSLIFRAHSFSKTAEDKIIKAGGKVETISGINPAAEAAAEPKK
ncbi:MAG: 50S ribosomal protein L15 [Omnitrophica WOR_2 bacterium RIFCSPHIGHO2_01_FULL_48_9]|nr:MAG: 50S ribosomal protein L15 [Omnitrophica WOR_2 bacterium RIFCSPHIGHO2_02_FULL_48_11]OGX33326.1 MAG: 50S ribosomal protein L15 [Omnitrophica WOR_2 bacterium RIFCSPHIGHO2_01_FULL_48_9]